jgi:hypothetical protein
MSHPKVQQSPGIKERCVLVDEVTPEHLVSWLNSGQDSPGMLRVKKIVQLLQRHRAVQHLWKGKTDAERERTVKILASYSRTSDNLFELLSRYWVSPRVVFSESGPMMFYVTTK